MRRKGMRYEEQARRYLEARGLRTLRQNFSCRFGEIDLILRDQACICLVEVKYRRRADFGGAAGAISTAKQRRIVRAARFFLAKNPGLMREALRFDALLIEGEDDSRLNFRWIRNAFYAE